jgi:hypothetical protein
MQQTRKCRSPALMPTDKLVLAALLNFQRIGGRMTPETETSSAETGIPQRTVSTASFGCEPSACWSGSGETGLISTNFREIPQRDTQNARRQ